MEAVDEGFGAAIEFDVGVGPVVLYAGGELFVFFGAEGYEFAGDDGHAVFAGVSAAGEAGEGYAAGGGYVVDGGAAGGEVEAFGAEVGEGEVFGGVEAFGGEVGGVLAAVAEIPHAEVGMIMADVGEEDWGVGHQLEDLHGEGGVHVGFGAAHDHFFGFAFGSVGVVEEGFGYVGGGVVFG